MFLRAMQGLSRKGLHATAFEVAKVMMILDPDDPMGAIFCMDYFALRSQNYRWLQVSLSASCSQIADWQPCRVTQVPSFTTLLAKKTLVPLQW